MALTEKLPYEPNTSLIHPVVTGQLDTITWDIYCAGYSGGIWRKKELAKHLIEWLPAIVLHPNAEPPEFGNWYQKACQAARHVFKTDKVDSRGEIGEILLHVICRQQYKTHPTIFKLFYKTGSNETVKGFDLIHTIYDSDQDEIDIWFGESKFYKSLSRAVTDAIESIKTHLDSGFLESEKALVGPKLDARTPGYEKLKYLIEDISVTDEEFLSKIVVPVFLTYDSEAAFGAGTAEEYAQGLSEFCSDHFKAFLENETLAKVRIKVFVLPLFKKKDLIEEFASRLKALQ